MAESETETPDTRTVELRTDQAEDLKALGGESDTYKTIIDDLLSLVDDEDSIPPGLLALNSGEIDEERIKEIMSVDAADAPQIDADDLADAVAAKVSKDVDTRLSAIEKRLDELEGRGR